MVLNSPGVFHFRHSSAPHDGTKLDRTIFPVWARPIFHAIVSKSFPVPPEIQRINGFYRNSGYFRLKYS
jgi:hypothetical protein